MVNTGKHLTPEALEIGGLYNFRYQQERLIYLGRTRDKIYSRNTWFQFAKVEKPQVVWAEVSTENLELLEETK
jgi:hypothetical protein